MQESFIYFRTTNPNMINIEITATQKRILRDVYILWIVYISTYCAVNNSPSISISSLENILVQKETVK